MSKTEASKPIPQGTGPAVDLLLRAIDEANTDGPIDAWLEKRIGNKDQISHVKTALRFAGLLSGDRLDPRVDEWRRGRQSLFRELVRCFQEGYCRVGCAAKYTALIGCPGVSKDAIRGCLEREKPFQDILKVGTRNNSLGFVTAFHERTLGLLARERKRRRKEKLKRIEAQGAASKGERPPGEPSAAETPGAQSAPMRPFAATVTTVRQPDPVRYRVARQQGDQWVYGLVSFQRQESLVDLLGDLPPEEHVRWLDGLASALLQEADRLKQEIARRPHCTDPVPSRP